MKACAALPGVNPLPSHFQRHFGPRSSRGTTLCELVIAIGLCSIGFSGLHAISLHCCRMVSAQSETIAANELIQERLDQVRSAGWNQLSSGPTLRDEVLNNASPFAGNLSAVREIITVSPYPDTTPAVAPLKVERLANGQVQITSEPPTGFSLRRLTAVRVNLRAEWVSRQNRRTRAREVSTVVAMGGILQ